MYLLKDYLINTKLILSALISPLSKSVPVFKKNKE